MYNSLIRAFVKPFIVNGYKRFTVKSIFINVNTFKQVMNVVRLCHIYLFHTENAILQTIKINSWLTILIDKGMKIQLINTHTVT